MADDSLKDPVVVRAVGINASSLPRGLNPAYEQYIISQVVDFTNVAGKANEAGQGAYDAQVKNEEQDLELANHEARIAAAEAKIVDHEIRITEAEGDIADLDARVTIAESDIDFITAELVDHESRIASLEYKTTRKKSEVVYSGISLVIPTTATNLVTLLKTLIPTSGTLAPFFNTTSNKMVVFNENKTLDFKLSLIGSWPGGTTNRSIQLTFSGSVPDTLVASRNVATVTDNVLLATFFSVDQGGFLATNGSTMTIQSNGAAFTATTIKIIAEQ